LAFTFLPAVVEGTLFGTVCICLVLGLAHNPRPWFSFTISEWMHGQWRKITIFFVFLLHPAGGD